jgi:hypothetical protein
MIETRSAEMQHCIDECESCRGVCLRTVAHCLDRRGRYAEPDHITTLLDCLDMCTTCANFLLRDSKAHVRTCELCAEICEVCAESCDRFPEDNVMRGCATACRRCAEACREMVRSAERM